MNHIQRATPREAMDRRPNAGVIYVRALSLVLVAGWLLAILPISARENDVEPAFDVAVATEEYLALLSPEQRERSDNYFEGGYWLRLWSFLYGLGIAAVFLGTKLSARMRDLAERLGRWRPLGTALYFLQYLVLTAILTFPLTVYQSFFREHHYGLSNQAFGGWLRDQLVALLVGAILGGLLMVVLYAVFRRAPRTWWLLGTAVTLLFLVFAMLIGPVYIAPLFNSYDLLEDPEFLDPILEMAHANGVDTDRVYQFDASRQSKRISANVSGFAGTMRISLNDNLLERCDAAEVQSVMGHELGHYVLNHIYESLIFFGGVILAGFAFLRWSFAAALERWGEHWNIRGIDDVAGLPLLAALLSIFFFIMTPFLNTYIRVNEAEADVFGLNAARQPDGFAEVAMKLSEYRKIDPGPIEEWIFFDHPSGRARVEMAMRWKAKNLVSRRSAASDPANSGPTSIDEDYPAALVEAPAELSSRGERLNGILYLAAGRGPHPTVVLLHGLPGNERNLDLAHALRRAGWNVAFFHYRGAWGSEGEFSFDGNVEDVRSMVEFLRGETARESYRVDPDRLVLVGHSMGGGTALVAASQLPEIRAAVSIAGADVGRLADLEGENRARFAAHLETLMSLEIPSGDALLDAARDATVDLRLTVHAGTLADKSLLLVTGGRDRVVDPAIHQEPLLAALTDAGAADVTEIVIEGADHAFSSRRQELISTILHWLDERYE